MITINNLPVNVTIFPDKTSQVWHLSKETLSYIENNQEVEIKWAFENEAELFHLLQLSKFIEITSGKPRKQLVLNAPYLPYGRQDKEFSNESCFAIKVFLETIGLFYDKLITIDVHNPDSLNGNVFYPDCTNVEPAKEIRFAIDAERIDFVVFPDKSAATRYKDLIECIPYVSADKVREPSTGEITGMTMPDIPAGARVLVLDDILDGGKSFTEVAKLVNKYNPQSLALYISHGIFSKGRSIIYDAGYANIYTKEGLCERP